MPVARRTLALALLGLLTLPAHAENELSRLHRVQVAPAEAEVAVRIFGSRAPDFTSFTMQNPFRVVVDWAGSALDGVADRQDFSRGVVRRIETQQFESEAERISRVTITLAQPVQFRFETAGKEVRVRFEQVPELPEVPEAEPAAPVPVPEPEDEPPPPDDPVLAELKKQPLPEGPLFEPAEPPAPPPPPPVVVAAAAPPPPPAPVPPPPASAPTPAPPPTPVAVVAQVSPPPAKIAAPVRVEVPAAPSAAAPVAPPARPEPVLAEVASREPAGARPPEPLARAAPVQDPASVPDPVPVPTPAPASASKSAPPPAPPPAPAALTADPAPLARFQPPAPPAPPAPRAEPTPPAPSADTPTPLARFEPKPAPALPEAARAEPAPPAPEAPVARAQPAPQVPLLPVVRAEPRREPAPVARAPAPPPPSFNKRFGDGFEVIQTGRGTQRGHSGARVIEPFQISRAPGRAPARAASAPAPASYSAAAPSFYAQSASNPAPSGAAKEVIDGGDDFEPGPREMRMIGFQQKPDKSAVYVRCDAKAKFRVERVSDTRVVLRLFDTRVPLENNKRPLDTSFFTSSVVGVKATEVGADTHVEVDLRGPVPFEVKRIGSYLYLYFNKS